MQGHSESAAFLVCLKVFYIAALQPEKIGVGFGNLQRLNVSLLFVAADMFLIGMLMSQFTITGFDACAHM